MTTTTFPRIGVSASPSTQELKDFASLLVRNAELPIGANRINRMVVDFTRKWPRASGYAFYLYFLRTVELSAEAKAALNASPEIRRVLSYADPTGETAVYNVMNHEQRPRTS